MAEKVTSIGEPMTPGRPWLQSHGDIVWRDIQTWAEDPALPRLRHQFGPSDTIHLLPELERFQTKTEANLDLLRELGVPVVRTEVKVQPIASYDYTEREQVGWHTGLRVVSERLWGPSLVSVQARTVEEYVAVQEATCHIVDGLRNYIDNRAQSGQPFLYDIFKPNQYLFPTEEVGDNELPLLVDVDPAFRQATDDNLETASQELDEFSGIVQEVLEDSFAYQLR